MTKAKAETTGQTTRQRSKRTGSPEFRRGCGASRNYVDLGAPQPLGSGARRARLLPNHASPTPAPRPRDFTGTPPSFRLRPVLMLNGKYDFFFPYETAQVPFYERLGTPATHKKLVVYETSHSFPATDMARESLAWLDDYLGPVAAGR